MKRRNPTEFIPKETHEYDDILYRANEAVYCKGHMLRKKRAAQFAPFAALKGFKEMIKEQERYVEPKKILDESKIAELDMKLRLLRDKIEEEDEIYLNVFIPDKRKDGGEYKDITGIAKEVSYRNKYIKLASGEIITFDNIYELDGRIFSRYGFD